MIAGTDRLSVEEILSAAVQHSLTAFSRLSADDLGRSSPCPAWTVGDVLCHLRESFDCLSAALNFGRVELDDPRGTDLCGTDLCGTVPPLPAVISTVSTSARSLDHAATRRTAARPIVVGGLPLHRDRVIVIAALEAAVHGWDLSAGCGRPIPIPDPLATALLPRLPGVVDAGGDLFAPELLLAGARTPGQRLLAALGRDWRFGH